MLAFYAALYLGSYLILASAGRFARPTFNVSTGLWSDQRDLNQQPLGSEADTLPPRHLLMLYTLHFFRLKL